MPVKNHIRKIRRDMGKSQEEFAKLLDISQQHLSKLENHEIINPSGETMLRIADNLDMSVEDIFYLA